MNAPELLKALEGAGGFITVADSRIRCEVPEQAMHLLPGLREQRREIARVIEERQRRLAQNVERWIAAKCVASSRCASNPSILHREFCRWSGWGCTEKSFVEELLKYGLGLDEGGMVTGLALGIDFVTACEYEQRH
jgi:hypothetical protein